MSNSMRLFTIRGITIRMHISFPLILIWGAIQFGLLRGLGVNGAIFGVIVFLLVFIIVVLHELGHSFAAQYYGVPVREIVLLPIGGVARLARIPEEPRQEFIIAIAGPAVNFGLAIVMAIVAFIFGEGVRLLNPGVLLETMGTLSLDTIFTYIFEANLFIALFNLIPAFPMDGGRILRALLATRMNYPRATQIAVSVGQTLAFVFGLWGFLGGGFFMILIAIFIYMGAGQEGQMVHLRHVLQGLTVAHAYSHEARTISPQATVREVVDLTLSSFQADFPVCDNGRLVGLLTQSRLMQALDQQGPDVIANDIMLTDIRPASPQEGMFAVQQRMMEMGVGALPVAEDGNFLGLLTSQDINEIYRLASSQPDLVMARLG